MRALAKRLVLRHIGLLPWFEYRLKLTRVPATIALRRAETSEVSRALSELAERPTARVVTVIPTYRRPVELARAVESALAQTVADHIVVVVSDGDDLPPLPDDRRLVAFRLSRNLGIVGAVRNVGIRVSHSEFLAFLDDDNLWETDHLEKALGALTTGTDMVYTGLHRVTPEGDTVDVLSVEFDRSTLRQEGYVDASTIVVRRGRGTVFSRVPRRYRDFPREDWELAWRLTRRRPARHVPAVTVRYVVHDGSHFTDWQASPIDGSTGAG